MKELQPLKVSIFRYYLQIKCSFHHLAIRTYHAELISLYHLTEKGLARII